MWLCRHELWPMRRPAVSALPHVIEGQLVDDAWIVGCIPCQGALVHDLHMQVAYWPSQPLCMCHILSCGTALVPQYVATAGTITMP
jgi:hypothetical protein